jgi:Holliday junction resolvasome RuvABC endonuclease subunit
MGVTQALKSSSSPRERGRYLSIDSSSGSLAFAVFDKNKEKVKLVGVGKINFAANMSQKLQIINLTLPLIFNKYKNIDVVIIEQTIYIQSPKTSRILSYIVGHIWGKCLEFCEDVRDVEIMKWKSHIGYKNVSKKEKIAWEKELGSTEAKKKAASERKERTKRLLNQKIPNISDISDYDIIDAMAIGLWATSNV